MPDDTESLMRQLDRAEAAVARMAAGGVAEPAALRELLALFARLRTRVGTLEAGPASGIEIERKYLLRGLPTAVRDVRPSAIEQGYLPGERLVERVRRVRAPDGAVRCYRTVKSGLGLARLEIEEAASEALFAALWPLTEGRRVLKERYVVPDGALRWEVDRFTDRELVLAEIELPDADARPPLPAWLAGHVVREVTGEPEYANSTLAR